MLFQKGGEPVSMEQRVVSVRTFGDTAVVSGTYIMKWRVNGSGARRARHLHACVQPVADALGVRECAADGGGGSGAGQAEDRTKKSNAPEPFHIPLLYQGAQPSQSATGQNTSTPAPN
jgi:hypothetical protein